VNLFIDTNILIDITADRKPFVQWAIKIFADANQGKWILYTSSASVLTTYYILEKYVGHKRAKETIRILLQRLSIQDIKKEQLLKGLISDFKDYEDAVQHECALTCQDIDYIVTRNKKDFKNSIIKVVSPEELYIK